MFRGVRYTVEDGTLVVRRRWGSRRIPLDAITAADRIDYANSWALSDTLGNEYALGTDVLAIRCGDEVAVNVSPPDEDAFLQVIGFSAPSTVGGSSLNAINVRESRSRPPRLANRVQSRPPRLPFGKEPLSPHPPTEFSEI